jgi:iron complex transport system substrate-binding protein
MRLCAAIFFWMAAQANAAISVQDDNGNQVQLTGPAQRVISLAPHVTELLFAAGAGRHVVGVSQFSDYPEEAGHIPQIGDSQQLDIERIVALKPDLLVVWQSGNSNRQLEQLRQLGIPIFYSEPRKLDDIPANISRLGHLLGTAPVAERSAAALRRKLVVLSTQYSRLPAVRVFYQVWDKPLYTLGGQHIVNDAIRLCGGENIFAALTAPAPSVGIESVLKANPEAIFGEDQNDPDGGIHLWQRFPALTAVRRGNLFSIDANLLSRPGPRMVDGVDLLCAKLAQVRRQRTK